MKEFAIKDRIKHRAWKYTGTIVDVPFEQTPLGYVMVVWDKEPDKESEAWIPAIMIDEDAEYDWGELLEDDA